MNVNLVSYPTQYSDVDRYDGEAVMLGYKISDSVLNIALSYAPPTTIGEKELEVPTDLPPVPFKDGNQSYMSCLPSVCTETRQPVARYVT